MRGFTRLVAVLFGLVLLLLMLAHALPRLVSGSYFVVGFAFGRQLLNDLIAGNWGVLGESFIPLLRLAGYIFWWFALGAAGIGFLRNRRWAWPWLGVAVVLILLLVQPWAPPEVRFPPGYTPYTP